jgi:pyrimidine-specific ribonucleoside hydrolase
MKHIIIDTDPGVDDALALMLALNSQEIQVEAVTTVDGNVNQEKCHTNAKKMLEFLRRTDIPVCRGAHRPLLRHISHTEEFHGLSGLGDATLPTPRMPSDPRRAPQIINQLANDLNGKLTLVAIGPLTNIATAILNNPDLTSTVSELVLMGGAFNLTQYGIGNANAVAEFNIWHDPEAARIVFNSGIPTVCVGLDVTTYPEYRMSPEMFNEIKELNTPRTELVVGLCDKIVTRFNGFSLHDPMTIAYTIVPSIFKIEKHKVYVETQGEFTRGMTVVDRRKNVDNKSKNANIVVKVDAPKFHRLIMERVVGD